MENTELIILGIKVGDWVQIGALLLAVIGLYYNTKEQKKTNFQERIKIVSNTINKIYHDKELSQMLYKVMSSNSSNPFIYTDDFHGSKDEIILDKLLFELDFLAKQYYGKILNIEDFSIIREMYLDINNNKEIQKYFNYLDTYYNSLNKTNEFSLSFRKISKEFSNLSSTEKKKL